MAARPSAEFGPRASDVPLYPNCVRHQHHTCLYNRTENGGQQAHPASDGQQGLLVLKVVNPTMAEQAADKRIKYEIVSVTERHGRFRKAVPCMPLALSVLLCLVNMLVPGVGTLLAGLTVLCGCATEYDKRCTAFCYNVLAAVLQLVTALVVVGWVWSIMWGITFVSISLSKREEDIVAAHV